MSRDMTCARKRLFKKRGRICEICGYDGYLELHHIIPVSKGGQKTLDKNLIILCEKCHADAHGYIKKKYTDPYREYWIGEFL